MQFEVGDKVKCVHSQVAGGREMGVGYVGIVTQVAQGSIVVDDYIGYGGCPVMNPRAFLFLGKAEVKAKAKETKVKIPAYAVVNAAGVQYLTEDREEAREEKFFLGGKKAGAVIYKLKIDKEIR